MLSNLKQDYSQLPNARYSLLRLVMRISSDAGFRSVFLYRLGHYFFSRKIRLVSGIIQRLMRATCDCNISVAAKIGPGLSVRHTGAITIGGKCIIGTNFNIRQGITVGGSVGKNIDGRSQPLIGDNVEVGAGAVVVGPIEIGSNVLIGANSVVVSDVPDNSVVVGVPGRIIKQDGKRIPTIEQTGDLARHLRVLEGRLNRIEKALGLTEKDDPHSS